MQDLYSTWCREGPCMVQTSVVLSLRSLALLIKMKQEKRTRACSPSLPRLRHSLQLLLDHFQLLLAGLHLSLTRADLAGHTHTHTHGAGSVTEWARLARA